MRIRILAASLILAAVPAYAADPIELLPVNIDDARASTGDNGSAGEPVAAGGDCRPTLFGGCVRNADPGEGQVAETSKPGAPSPSNPGTPSTPSKPDPVDPAPDPKEPPAPVDPVDPVDPKNP